MNEIILYTLLIFLLFFLAFSILFAKKATTEVFSLISSVESLPIDESISLEKLSKIEASIENLKQVFIFSNLIDAPEGDLKNAVIKNFKNNVKYNFVISKNNYEEFKETYYKIFEAYSNIAKVNPNKLLKIYPLEIEWGDKPYVFYRFHFEKKFHVIGFVGFELNKGIATSYLKLERDIAYTLFNTAIAACDVNIDVSVNREEFENNKIIKLKIAS
jgi:hypothetical protein